MPNLEDDIDDFESGELKALIDEGERSIAEEGTIDGDEAFQERQRQIRALRLRCILDGTSNGGIQI